VVARKSSSTSRTTGVALALLALGLLARPLSTAVLVVDDNCSLVDAIHAANENLPQGGCPGGDPGEDLIMLTSDVVLTEGIPYGQDGTPEIVEDLTLQGSGFSVTRESDGDFRLFRVGVGARLHALDLAIRGGSAFFGGAIYNRGSTTLTRTDLSDHTGIDRGGAVYNLFGSLTLVDSTISASKTFGSGAGIWNYGDLTIRGSTISASSGVGFPVYIGGDEYSFQVEISDSHLGQRSGRTAHQHAARGDLDPKQYDLRQPRCGHHHPLPARSRELDRVRKHRGRNQSGLRRSGRRPPARLE